MAINGVQGFNAQQFRPQAGAPGAITAPGQAQGGQGLPGDQFGLSNEAQQAGGAQGVQGRGPAQQFVNQLKQGVMGALQEQLGGGGQQGGQGGQGGGAVESLKGMLQQGQQSGVLNQARQIDPLTVGMAESLAGAGGGEKGQEAGGGAPAGGGGAPEAGGAAEEGGKAEEAKEETPFGEDFLKKLEELLGKDKAEEVKEEAKAEGEDDKKTDDKDGKKDVETKAGESKASETGDKKTTETKTDSKVTDIKSTKTDTKTSTKVSKPKAAPAKTAASKPKSAPKKKAS